MWHAAAEIKVGTELSASGEKKAVGKVHAVAERFGVAHVRLAPALAAAEAGSQLQAAGSDASVTPFRPDWWPEQWGKEEQS